MVFVGILSWWAATRRVTMRGYTALHVMVMIAWSVAWVATVLIGTSLFPARVALVDRWRSGDGRGRVDRRGDRVSAEPAVSSQGLHPRHRLDDVIHSPVRFSIMATLARGGSGGVQARPRHRDVVVMIGRPWSRMEAVVRCTRGALFETLWLPMVSLTSMLGSRRLQRCPVHHR